MLCRIALIGIVALAPGMAQAACPADVHDRIAALTETGRAGGASAAEFGSDATEIVNACGENRGVLSQLLGMFTYAGIAAEDPSDDRLQLQIFAFRTAGRIVRAGSGDFDPVRFTAPDGSAQSWGPLDERNSYWDLMFAMSSDFLVFGMHTDIYTPGKIEQIGCGLYPDEEASALAEQAVGNLDGGELMARVAYLGRHCDTEDHETSGYAARYFANHAKARARDGDYAGLTEGDIRAGIGGFLDLHLGGGAKSWLFDPGEVARLRAF